MRNVRFTTFIPTHMLTSFCIIIYYYTLVTALIVIREDLFVDHLCIVTWQVCFTYKHAQCIFVASEVAKQQHDYNSALKSCPNTWIINMPNHIWSLMHSLSLSMSGVLAVHDLMRQSCMHIMGTVLC